MSTERPLTVVGESRPTVAFEQYLEDVQTLVGCIRRMFHALRVEPSGEVADLLAKLEATKVADIDPELGKFWDDYNDVVQRYQQIVGEFERIAMVVEENRERNVAESTERRGE